MDIILNGSLLVRDLGNRFYDQPDARTRGTGDSPGAVTELYFGPAALSTLQGIST